MECGAPNATGGPGVSESHFKEMIEAGHRTRTARRKAFSGAMLSLTGIATALALVPLFWIIGYVVYQGGRYINLAFFTELPRPLGMAGGGVLNSIQGTLVIVVLSCVFSLPPGVLAAFYAAQHPNTPLGVGLRFSTDVVAGVPSIVIGLFAYAVMVKPMGHYSALAGGVATGILMLPTVVRTTEEMLKLVPHSLREGSLALGAAEWKTSLSVMFPAALSGILTGFLLAISRAAGETAPLLFTALGNDRYDIGLIIRSGVAQHQGLMQIVGRIVDQPADSLPLTLWKYAQQPYPERVQQSWAVALVLMILVLMINIVSRLWIESRLRKLRG
jgi:phosphate transport system permease protein